MPASMWLPAAALLPMIQLTRVQEPARKLATRLALLGICLIPVYLLGFRTLIVIPLMQCFAILHYLRHRVSVLRCISVGLILVSLMTLYGLSRSAEVPTWRRSRQPDLGQVWTTYFFDVPALTP